MKSTLISLVQQDLRFLHRQGLLYLYAFLTLLYALALLLLPDHLTEILFPVLLFTDPAVMAFFFSGAMVFLESDQGVLSPLFVTPVDLPRYLLSRCISLGSIALSVSLILALLHGGIRWSIISLLIGVGSSSILFTLLGILLCLRFSSFTNFLIFGGILEAPLILPFLKHLNIWDHWILRFIPTDGVLNLINHFQKVPLAPGQYIQSLLVILIPAALLFPLTLKQLRTYLVRRGL